MLNCNFLITTDQTIHVIKKDYTEQKEIKATLSIEMGAEKKEQVLRFVFGDNNIEILNK